MATLCAETNAILKLDLGDKGGIRRIALAKLWDPTASCVSYQRLSEMALEHSSLYDSKIYRVTVTYTDEDGDSITISTDDELTDAFEQFAARVPPIVRAKASFEVEKDSKRIVKGLKQAVTEIGETAKSSETKVGQMQVVLDSFLMILNQAVDTLSKNVDGMQQRKKGCGSSAKEDRSRNRGNKARCSEIKKREPNAARKEKEEHKDEDETTKVEKKQAQGERDNILPVKADLDKDFIHGRHTCDGCLVTPIIGIRYHALNSPDHDLCDKCVLTHTGKDIIFEPTELERDRCLQNKWKRRQWRQNRGEKGCNGRKMPSANLAVCSSDTALKVAIHQSLQDVKLKTKEELKDKKTFTKEDDIIVEPLERDNKTRLSENEEKKVGAIMDGNDEVKVEAIKNEDSGIKVETEAIVEENDKDEEEALAVENENNNCKENMKIPYAEDNENASFAKEVSLFTTEPKIVEKTDKHESLPNKSIESSFTEDAEGQGDVAIAIGMALDVTANAIDAIVSEAEKPGYTTVESQTQAGCTILGSVNTANSNDVSEESSQTQSSVNSNDEWQVLHEDGQDTSDETIAQAAQLLGSALFQSDIISDVTEIKDGHTITTDQSMISGPSYVGSVPTDVSTIVSKEISSVVLSRWDTELKLMHELGFLDDKENVNALEHLEAANMGVDSDEPVTVNDAVNYLFSVYRETY